MDIHIIYTTEQRIGETPVLGAKQKGNRITKCQQKGISQKANLGRKHWNVNQIPNQSKHAIKEIIPTRMRITKLEYIA